MIGCSLYLEVREIFHETVPKFHYFKYSCKVLIFNSEKCSTSSIFSQFQSLIVISPKRKALFRWPNLENPFCASQRTAIEQWGFTFQPFQWFITTDKHFVKLIRLFFNLPHPNFNFPPWLLIKQKPNSRAVTRTSWISASAETQKSHLWSSQGPDGEAEDGAICRPAKVKICQLFTSPWKPPCSGWMDGLRYDRLSVVLSRPSRCLSCTESLQHWVQDKCARCVSLYIWGFFSPLWDFSGFVAQKIHTLWSIFLLNLSTYLSFIKANF